MPNLERRSGHAHGERPASPYYVVRDLEIHAIPHEPQVHEPLPRSGTLFENAKRAMKRITRSGK